MQGKVDVLTLNFNDAMTTIEYVNRIKGYNNIDHILIVDNKSTDNSYEMLKSNFEGCENVEIVCTDHNGGYGAGNNFGIRYLNERYKSDFILLSNPDVIVDENVIDIMADFLRTNKDYSVVAPFMCDARGKKDLNSAFRIPSCLNYVLSMEMLYSKFAKAKVYDNLEHTSDDFVCVDGVSGSMFMLRSQDMLEYGMYDENVFLYAEETILGIKLQKANKKIALLPNITFIHNHSVSISKTYKSLVSRKKLCCRSQLYVIKNYYKASTLVYWLAKVVAEIGCAETMLYSWLKQVKSNR